MNIVLVNTYMHTNKRKLATQVVFTMEVFSWPWMEFEIGEHMGPRDNIVACKSV